MRQSHYRTKAITLVFSLEKNHPSVILTFMNQIEKTKELLERGVEEIIGKDELIKKLESGETLRVKLGIDPTSPDIHLGRGVQLLKLRDFQELGHQVVFLIGNFTAEIGDTSDKESERPMLTTEDVENNLKTYLEQAAKIIDLEKTEIVYNKEWLSKLGYQEIGKQADAFSLNEFISRDNIKKRLDAGKRVSLRELLYPLMQGYDSVVVKADVELGGTDQRFNILAGRDLQKLYGQDPQSILLAPIIEGLDGRKMSSSYGNGVFFFDTPQDMFGKIMSLHDDFIIKYFQYFTRVDQETIKKFDNQLVAGENPKNIKIELAKEIVRMYHTSQDAEDAQKSWEATFSQAGFPEDAEVVEIDSGTELSAILIDNGFTKSKTEFRRFLENKSLKHFVNDDFEVIEEDLKVTENMKVKVGKKRFVVISVK